PLPAMAYEERVRSLADTVQLYRQDASGWRSCKRTNEVSIYWRPSTEFSGNIGDVCVPEAVWKCLKPEAGGLRTKWDQNVKDFELIETISDTISICRTITPSAFMKIISPRDFVDVVLIKQYEDGTIASAATNVEHALCPPQPTYVRGFNYPCGCFCIPIPGTQGLLHCTAAKVTIDSDFSCYLYQWLSTFPDSCIVVWFLLHTAFHLT
uniref:StAR related lipid transfer domain containing 5 n=1 Tax=Chelonoidis abingdonii TaxID=106734 RepID=A0A8C0GE13_CHEAB